MINRGRNKQGHNSRIDLSNKRDQITLGLKGITNTTTLDLDNRRDRIADLNSQLDLVEILITQDRHTPPDPHRHQDRFLLLDPCQADLVGAVDLQEDKRF